MFCQLLFRICSCFILVNFVSVEKKDFENVGNDVCKCYVNLEKMFKIVHQLETHFDHIGKSVIRIPCFITQVMGLAIIRPLLKHTEVGLRIWDQFDHTGEGVSKYETNLENTWVTCANMRLIKKHGWILSKW